MQSAPSVTAPLFSASLTPHRALSKRGRMVLVAFVAMFAAIPGLVFYSLGAWPVVGFMGLDVAAIWLALTLSSRDGKRHETVTLHQDRLEIVQVDRRGNARRTLFSPQATKLVVVRDSDERTTEVRLKSDKRELEIGSFLALPEKASFAQAFGTMLRRVRH
jgi:uncharacterized membrane protein